MPRTKKISHYVVEFEAGKENRIYKKVCNEILFKNCKKKSTMSSQPYATETLGNGDFEAPVMLLQVGIP